MVDLGEINIERINDALTTLWRNFDFWRVREGEVVKIQNAIKGMNEENAAAKLSDIIHIFVKDAMSNSVEFFLQLPGIDLNVQDEYGKTPVDYANDLDSKLKEKDLIIGLLNSYSCTDIADEKCTCVTGDVEHAPDNL
ncbi:MAG: hypothetical protein KA998_04955 [Rickettsiaceae bacterium]|nr:hypothetical protein [Rickettsiaceae bacterium]